jgi:hypothetical protein
VVSEREADVAAVPLIALVAAAALKVVDEKPQEETTSSTSVVAVEPLAEDH